MAPFTPTEFIWKNGEIVPWADAQVLACLREAGLFEEAETAAVAAMARAPTEAVVLTEAAWVSVNRKEWREAFARAISGISTSLSV